MAARGLEKYEVVQSVIEITVTSMASLARMRPGTKGDPWQKGAYDLFFTSFVSFACVIYVYVAILTS